MFVHFCLCCKSACVFYYELRLNLVFFTITLVMFVNLCHPICGVTTIVAIICRAIAIIIYGGTLLGVGKLRSTQFVTNLELCILSNVATRNISFTLNNFLNHI